MKRVSAILAQWIFLSGLALVIYLPSFKAAFHFDDQSAIVNNNYIQVQDLKPATLYRAAFQDFGHNRPLTNLSFALNFYANGLDPFGYHVANFILLILAALGILLLLEKVLPLAGMEKSRAGTAAFLAALVWIVHPVNTQAITYIVQRHASMAGAFSVWSIYFFHLGREKNRRAFYLLSALVGVFAVLSKETALVLPAIIFIYKLYFFDDLAPGWPARNFKAIVALLVFYACGIGLLLRPSMLKTITDFSDVSFTARQQFLSEPRALLWYPFIIAFPFPQFLNLIHNFNPSNSIFNLLTFVPFLVVFGLVFLALAKARQWKIFSFAVLWYFGQLAIEALPLPIDLVNEHRLYLASLGIIVPLVAIAIDRAKRMRIAFGWIALIAAFFCLFSWQRNRVWTSEISLWRDTTSKAPGYVWSWYNYCTTLAQAGNCGAAVPACKQAALLKPDDCSIHHNLGLCYAKTNQPDLAEKELTRAKELAPKDFTKPYYSLAEFYSGRKEFEAAIKIYGQLIGQHPENLKARYALAQTYLVAGREDDYINEMREILKLSPAWTAARIELSWFLARSGKCPDALKLLSDSPTEIPGARDIKTYCQNH